MGKSTSGPDWTDISTYLDEIQKATGCSLILVTSTDGSDYGCQLRCCCVASRERKLDQTGPMGVSAQVTWPCRAHKTFEGAVFALLARVDSLLTKQVFEQTVLGA